MTMTIMSIITTTTIITTVMTLVMANNKQTNCKVGAYCDEKTNKPTIEQAKKQAITKNEQAITTTIAINK